MAEVLSHHADGAEVRLQVHNDVAWMAGYLLGDAVHADFDSLGQRVSTELRPYQLEALDSMAQQQDQGAERNLLDMGMGLGKTTVALANTMRYCKQTTEAGGAPPECLWLADSTFLLNQARARLQELYPDVTTKLITGKRDHGDAQYTFATLQTMEKIKKEFDPRKYGQITVDESHHGPARTYSNTITYFKPEYLLGITGTAYRTDGQILSELFGDTIYNMPMTRGMAEGWLVPLDYRLQVDRAVRRILNNSDDDMAASRQLLEAPERYKAIRKVIRKTQQEVDQPRTIIFTPGKKNSRLLADIMPEVDVLDSGVSPNEQTRILDGYRDGTNNTIATVDMASEGLDVPETNMIALLRLGTRGLFEQQIGRGVRMAEGKERLIVLDFAANGQRLYVLHTFLEDIRKEYRQYHRSRSKEANPDQAPDEAHIEELVDQSMSSHSFKFTQQQLDIVARMRQLQEAPKAESEWKTAKSIGLKHDTTPSMIMSIVKDLRLEGTIMRGEQSQELDLFYSPMQQTYITLAIAWNNQTKNWDSFSSLQAKTGKSRAVLIRIAKRTGILFRPVRIGSALTIIPPESSATIMEESLMEGMSVSELAIRSGKNRHQVKKVIRKLELEGKEMGGRPKAPTIVYLATDSKAILAELEKLETFEPKPEDYTTQPDARRTMPDIDLATITKKLDIQGTWYANQRNQATRCYSPSEMAAIKKEYDAMEKGTPIAKVAKQFGVSEHKARELAMEVFGKDRKRLTDEEIITFSKAPYVARPTAPPAYRVKTHIMRDAGMYSYTFDRAVDALGIKPDDYKTNDRRPLLLPHYTPAEEAAILAYAEGNEETARMLLRQAQSAAAISMPQFTVEANQEVQKPAGPAAQPLFFFGQIDEE